MTKQDAIAAMKATPQWAKFQLGMPYPIDDDKMYLETFGELKATPEYKAWAEAQDD